MEPRSFLHPPQDKNKDGLIPQQVFHQRRLALEDVQIEMVNGAIEIEISLRAVYKAV